MSFESCFQKQKSLCEIFKSCSSTEEIYKMLISLGERLPAFEKSEMKTENLVSGCQSNLWLYLKELKGKISFFVRSDALISAGTAALFVLSYSDETPETIIGCPPIFFEQIKLPSLLSPGRTNGALSLHLRMKQLSIPYLNRIG